MRSKLKWEDIDHLRNRRSSINTLNFLHCRLDKNEFGSRTTLVGRET
jgi:hypothetical protein